jgi:tRNA modification GTPase
MDQDWQLASRLSAPAVVAANKSDLRREADEQELRRLIPWAPVVSVSALRGTGLKELSEAIVSAVRSGEVGRDASRFALTAEQHNRLRNVLMLLHGAARAGKEGLSEEFIALDLREAVAILGCVTGRSAIDSILDEIFSRFCIGK